MLAWLAHFIERHPVLHRMALSIWRHFPPRLAGFLKGIMTTNWAVGAVALMIDEGQDPPEVLLVEHSYRKKGRWGLPGGSLESRLGNPLRPREGEARDDVLESTLRREVYEELGIEIVIGKIVRIDAVPYVPEEPGPYRLDFYFRCTPRQGFDTLRAELDSGKLRPRSPEVNTIRLIPMPLLPEYDLYSSDADLLLHRLPQMESASVGVGQRPII